MTEMLIALVALTAMEIVLGIDNIVFIAIITGRLPKEQQPRARFIGLAAALVSRVILLCTLSYILKLVDPIFELSSLGITAFVGEHWKEINDVSVKDLIVLGGGLFLLAKSVHEIHNKIEGHEEEHKNAKKATFTSVIVQIAILDIVFSLDSVITAVGMADDIRVMITAVVLAMIVMLIFAKSVSDFVERHPTVKMLALSFLMLIGVMLIAEGVGSHFDKGYIYFAMAFSLVVELLNLKMKSKKARKQPA